MASDRCINIEGLRKVARRRLPKPIFDFLEGGADDEWTACQNLKDFDNYALLTRTLVDIGTINLETRLLGQSIEWPVIMAPTGATELMHYSGETAVARAAGDRGTMYTLSTMSNQSLEEVAAVNAAPKIFQLYVFKDRGLVGVLVDRCKEAGYKALCLTVDTPLSGNRERDRANGLSIPPKWTFGNVFHFAMTPQWSFNAAFRCKYELANFRGLAPTTTDSNLSALEYVNSQFDRTVTWDDAAWLAKQWAGPLAIKGIVSAEDARRAVDIGATAIWVSNHGGRQLDGVQSTIECLPAIRTAVGDEAEIILDGGIRRGTHVLKALALGANACAIGRPYLYGLAAAGYVGVIQVLDMLRSELERDMALAGCASLSDIGPHNVVSTARPVS
jgi:L-lactate dehydrogenase (cytochrome)